MNLTVQSHVRCLIIMSESLCLWRIFYWATAFMVLTCQARNLGCLLCPKTERNGGILVLYPIMLAESSGRIQKSTFNALSKKIFCLSYCNLCDWYYQNILHVLLPLDILHGVFPVWPQGYRWLCFSFLKFDQIPLMYLYVIVDKNLFLAKCSIWLAEENHLLFFKAPFITNSLAEIYPHFTYTMEKKAKLHSLWWFDLSLQLSPTQLLIHSHPPSVGWETIRRIKVRKSWTEVKTG